MTAGLYCNRETIVTEPATTVAEAARLMRRHHVGSLVVVERRQEENVPVDIVTDRDLVVEVLAQDIPPASVLLRDFMSTDLVTVDEGVSLFDALDVMRTRGIRRLVVVNGRGGLAGLLCADDVVELVAEAAGDLVTIIRQELRGEARKHP